DDADAVSADNLYITGTIATISSVERGLGGVRLVLTGHDRANALRFSESGGHLVATVAPAVELPPLDPAASTFVALHRDGRGRERPSLPRSAACPKRQSSRCSIRSPSPVSSATSLRTTSMFRSRSARACSRRSRSTIGCAMF